MELRPRAIVKDVTDPALHVTDPQRAESVTITESTITAAVSTDTTTTTVIESDEIITETVSIENVTETTIVVEKIVTMTSESVMRIAIGLESKMIIVEKAHLEDLVAMKETMGKEKEEAVRGEGSELHSPVAQILHHQLFIRSCPAKAFVLIIPHPHLCINVFDWC